MDRLLEFAGNNTLLVFALVASFLLVIFTELRRKASGMLAVVPTEAVKLINNDAMVLDLRSAESFSRGHIAGARNVPMDELDGHMEKLAKFRNKPVVAVCDAYMGRANRARGIVQERSKRTGCQAYQDFRKIIADPRIDAVVISTPHTQHYSQTRHCLSHGLHSG